MSIGSIISQYPTFTGDAQCSVCGQWGLHACHPATTRCDCHSCTQARRPSFERQMEQTWIAVTPCGHNAPLQLEYSGHGASNFCPVCRAVEAERERCAKIASDYREWLWNNGDTNDTYGTCDLIADMIRGGE